MENIRNYSEKKVNRHNDQVHDDVSAAQRKAVDLVEKTFSNAEEAIDRVKTQGERVWEKAKSKSQDFLEDIENSGQKTWKQTKTYLQKRPAKTVTVAALLGIVVGALLFSRDSD